MDDICIDAIYARKLGERRSPYVGREDYTTRRSGRLDQVRGSGQRREERNQAGRSTASLPTVQVGIRTGLPRADAARFPAQEAFPAVDRSALSRFKGDCGFTPALRARGHGFALGEAATTPGGTLALSLTGLATLGFVLKILVVEEVLFSRCKDEICSAIDALEDAVLEFRHTRFST